MKKILLFLFFTFLSFSQEKKLTVSQIDSIVKTIKPKVESSGIIQKKKKKIIGGVGNTTYEFEKKLIYSYYNESTRDKEYEFLQFYEFYFFNEKPIFIKINVEKTNIKDNSKEIFKVELNETESTSFKEIKNPLLINLRMKLNKIIFDLINYKLPE
ncbi:hypothetical protein [Flavobacterium sp.]|jgi:hypothetical protein|uniref:hypothetical protein n=1 Tax=Flavobacterium sp. TaxID=239 RepID=UPI0037C05BE6